MRFFMVLCCVASQAAGDPFCDAAAALASARQPYDMALPNNGASVTCTQSLALGGATQITCGWPFAFRSAHAQMVFDDGAVRLANCFGAVTNDPDVNHPDTYDLRIFQAGSTEIGWSLKDKGALNQTYIFLRVAP